MPNKEDKNGLIFNKTALVNKKTLVSGRMDGKAGLRIAYSNQKLRRGRLVQWESVRFVKSLPRGLWFDPR